MRLGAGLAIIRCGADVTKQCVSLDKFGYTVRADGRFECDRIRCWARAVRNAVPR